MPNLLRSSQKRHKKTRQQHALETAEDYTELIAHLIKLNGQARIKDIAKHLGITHVTAIKTVRRLARDGYLRTQNHKPIILTRSGQALAKLSAERHQLLIDFLIKIGVPSSIAEIDVEGIEHHISDKTVKVIRKFLGRY